MQDLNNTKFYRFRGRLEHMLDELLLLRDTSADHRAIVQLDQQSVGRISRIEAMQSQQIALAADRQRQQKITRIRRALSLMDQGCYGYCAACGNDIPDERLNVDPSAPLCITCASVRSV